MRQHGKQPIWTILCAGLFLLAHTACASNWSASGATCQPDPSSLGRYTYLYPSATIFVWPGGTLEVIVRCQVLNPLDSGAPTWTNFTINYTDADGTANGEQVRAKFERVDKTTGTSHVIASFDSDTYAPCDCPNDPPCACFRTVLFGHTFNFDNNAYFVEVTLDLREFVSVNGPTFSSIRID